MKKIKYVAVAAVLAASAVGMLAGCGPKDVPEAGREVLVTVAVLNNASEKQTISKFIKAFKEAQPRIDVKAKYIDSAYYSPVLTSWAGNTLADIVWTAGDKHAPLSEAGLFEPLNAYFEKTPGLLDDLYPSLVETTKLSPEKKEMYFVPRDYNKLTVVYNKDMFDAAGVAYPENGWTWNDMMETCKQLREKMDANVEGLSDSLYPMDGYLSWMPVAYTIVKGFGGEFMNEEGNSVLVNNNSTEAAAAGLEQIKTMTEKYYAGIDVMGQQGLFQGGQAAMRFITRPAMVDFTEIERYDFVSFPKMPVNNVVGVGCSGYGINSHSSKKDDAWEFLKFIISKEGQEAFCDTGNGVPVLKSMRNEGVWRQRPTEGLNQEAFVYEGTDDLFLNYYCHAPATVYSDLDTRFQQLIQGVERWSEMGYDSLDQYIRDKHTDIQNIINKG